MSVHIITRNGKKYYRWGDHGALYRTKEGAVRQARAAYAHGYRGRARPRQHVRRLRSGWHTVVNRGVRRLHNYGSTVSDRQFERFVTVFDKIRNHELLKDKTFSELRDDASNHLFDDHPETFGLTQRDGDFLRSYLQHEAPKEEKKIKERYELKSYGSWLFRQQVKQRIQGDARDKRNLKKFTHHLEKRPELLEQIGQTPIHVFGPKKVELHINPFKPNDIDARVRKGRGVQGIYFPKGKDSPHGLLGISTSNITGDIYTQPKLFGKIPLRKEKWSPSAGYRNIEGFFSLGGTLKHELQHKKQEQEGRLLAPTANKDYQKYWNNPLEVEARKAEFLNPDERRVQAIDTPAKVEAGMRGLFE